MEHMIFILTACRVISSHFFAQLESYNHIWFYFISIDWIPLSQLLASFRDGTVHSVPSSASVYPTCTVQPMTMEDLAAVGLPMITEKGGSESSNNQVIRWPCCPWFIAEPIISIHFLRGASSIATAPWRVHRTDPRPQELPRFLEQSAVPVLLFLGVFFLVALLSQQFLRVVTKWRKNEEERKAEKVRKIQSLGAAARSVGEAMPGPRWPTMIFNA